MGIIDLGYAESVENLRTRIDAHAKYSQFEINDWIIENLEVGAGERILDVACGSGKQVVAYAERVGPRGVVAGSDVSRELLIEASLQAAKAPNNRAYFVQHDANAPMPWRNGVFDKASCCFAMYYLKNIRGALAEFERVLRSRGILFVVGPASDNVAEFLEMHAAITRESVPNKALTRTRRMEEEILPLVAETFHNTRCDRFVNEVRFPEAAAVVDYYKSSLLFDEGVSSGMDGGWLSLEMRQLAEREIAGQGFFSLTKRVVGVYGEKG